MMEAKQFHVFMFGVLLFVSRQDVQVLAQVGTVPDSILQYLYSLTSGPASSSSLSNPVSGSLNPPPAPPSALDLPLNISAQPLPDPFVEVANMSANNSQPQSPIHYLQEVMDLLKPATTQDGILPQQQNVTTVVPAPVSPAAPAPFDLGGFGHFFLNTTATPILPTTNGVIADPPALDPNQNNNLLNLAGGSGGSPTNAGASGSDPYAGGTPVTTAPSMPMPVVNRGPLGLNLDAVNAIGVKPPAPSSWVQQPSPSLLPPPPTQQPQPQHQEAPANNAIIPPEIQLAAMNLGRRMGITQHYEAHGCVDPTAAAPPGAHGPGLMFSCHHPQSEHACEAAGVLAGGSVSNMASIMSAMSPGFQQTLEECLSHQTLNKVISEMSNNNGRRGMNPLLLASLMGSGGGESMMMAMAMMSAMQRKTTAAAAMPAGQQEAPRGLLETFGSPGQATGNGGHSSVTRRCMMVLSDVMGAEGGILSPEAVELIADKRKQMLPYSCQDITAGFMPFRMCCPGKVPKPTPMEIMMAGGLGA